MPVDFIALIKRKQNSLLVNYYLLLIKRDWNPTIANRDISEFLPTCAVNKTLSILPWFSRIMFDGGSRLLSAGDFFSHSLYISLASPLKICCFPEK